MRMLGQRGARSRNRAVPLTGKYANFVGVRRPGVTEAARKLQQQGLIEKQRGRIVVLDRKGLESAACSCYGAITLECERVMNGRIHAGVR